MLKENHYASLWKLLHNYKTYKNNLYSIVGQNYHPKTDIQIYSFIKNIRTYNIQNKLTISRFTLYPMVFSIANRFQIFIYYIDKNITNLSN